MSKHRPADFKLLIITGLSLSAFLPSSRDFRSRLLNEILNKNMSHFVKLKIKVIELNDWKVSNQKNYSE